MSESKHTQAPLMVVEDDIDDKLHITNANREGKVPFAEISIGWDGPIEEEQHAYARLFAAAPALLEALKELTDLASSFWNIKEGNIEEPESWDEAVVHWVDHARAAIAAAEGKS